MLDQYKLIMTSDIIKEAFNSKSIEEYIRLKQDILVEDEMFINMNIDVLNNELTKLYLETVNIIKELEESLIELKIAEKENDWNRFKDCVTLRQGLRRKIEYIIAQCEEVKLRIFLLEEILKKIYSNMKVLKEVLSKYV